MVAPDAVDAPPTEMQALLARAVAEVQKDATASAHPFIGALLTVYRLPDLGALVTALSTCDPWDGYECFGEAITKGFSLGKARLAAQYGPVRDLAVAAGLVVAERLVVELQPRPEDPGAAAVPVDDPLLAAIVAAGWLGFGLALVWDPGRTRPVPVNVMTDLPELQLGVVGPLEAARMEVRRKASDLLGRAAPTGPGSAEMSRRLVDRLHREQGIKPVFALRLGSEGPGTTSPLLAHQGELKAQLGVELFRYGPVPSAAAPADRKSWAELADELGNVIEELRRAHPQPMAAPNLPASREIFVSYSRKDRELCTQLRDHLAGIPAAQVWCDLDELKTGEEWEPETQRAVEGCGVAVLLISKHFVTSRFINTRELPRLQQRAASGTVKLYPVLVSSCAVDEVPHLRRLQIRCKDKALNLYPHAERERELADITTEIAALLPPAEPTP